MGITSAANWQKRFVLCVVTVTLSIIPTCNVKLAGKVSASDIFVLRNFKMFKNSKSCLVKVKV